MITGGSPYCSWLETLEI